MFKEAVRTTRTLLLHAGNLGERNADWHRAPSLALEATRRFRKKTASQKRVSRSHADDERRQALARQ
jgi:hypothetical protein